MRDDEEQLSLLQRLSPGVHGSSVELDDMLEEKRGAQMDQHYLCSAATLNPPSLDIEASITPVVELLQVQ